MIKRERDENENSQSAINDPLDADDGDGEGWDHLQDSA